MDLTKQFPRSPRQRIGGISMFPRTIDKARAQMAGTLGEYIYDCNMDKKLFETLGCTAEQFLDAVKVSSTDQEVHDLLVPNRIPDDKIKTHNARIDNWLPLTPDSWDRYKADLKAIANNDPRVKSRTDLIDFEEGRLGAK
ncbi:MAG: DUF5069 domain-containing protein [Candidatus Eremiobacteraeota bacterium]|nr:DUF5069 domain-containing protein [Candidatus Eremiobacteraeota bacterium]